MCRSNAVTQDHIDQMRTSLLKRLANRSLKPEQRAMLQAQLDYVIANITERPAVEPSTGSFAFGAQ